MTALNWDYSAAVDRIEELAEFIENFPDSPLAPVFEREIQALKEKYLID